VPLGGSARPIICYEGAHSFCVQLLKVFFFNEVIFFLVKINRSSLQQQGVLRSSNGHIERKKRIIRAFAKLKLRTGCSKIALSYLIFCHYLIHNTGM